MNKAEYDINFGPTITKEIQSRQKEELVLYHQQFLQNPISTQIRRLLELHEKNIVDFLAVKAMDVVGTTDQQFRQYGVQLNETRKIINTIFNAETFINKSNNI